MPSRRNKIEMTPDELQAFLENGYTLQVASNGPRGAPHLAAMWYSLDETGLIQFTTFTKSQKIVNLQRDPHITCMLEDGKAYSELRGLVVEGQAVCLHVVEPDVVCSTGVGLRKDNDCG